jgi:DNA primase
MKDGREARFLFLPDGEDPDTLVRKTGTDAFETLLANATPLSDFLFDKLARDIDMHSLGGRAKLAEQAKPMLNRLPTGVFRTMMFHKLSETVGVDLSEQTTTEGRPARQRPLKSRSFLGTMPPLRRAIALLLTHPQFAQIENLPGQWQQISMPGITLLQELLEILQTQPNLKPAALLERWRGREEEKHLIKLSALMFPLQEEGLATEFVATLKSLDAKQHELETDQLLQKAQSTGLSDAEKQRLNQLLKSRVQGPETGTLVDED